MNKEKYEELILRFAKELHDVGVTEDMKKIVEDQYTRAPNVVGANTDEVVRKFTYLHDGYEIQAVQTVKLSVRKCK
jgi:hypothetical protein|tara:strand:- start:192 stop:419 length:228 start_codon:yes stop_codon:yes gene_type:complete